MTLKFIRFILLCFSTASSVTGAGIGHDEICDPSNMTFTCDINKFLLCTKEYDLPGLNGTCQCRASTHYEYRDETCVLDAEAPCDRTGPKCPPGSSCISNVCNCSSGFVVTTSLNRPKICVGDIDTPCYNLWADENIELLDDSTTESTVEPTTESRTEPPTTENPLQHVNCNNGVGLSCRSNVNGISTCQCQPTSVYSAYRRKCVIRPDRACSTSTLRDDDVCVENARCIGSRCICLEGFSENAKNGHCEASFGSSCSSTVNKTDCNSAQNLQCVDNLCTCKAGTALDPSSTGCKSLPRQNCENDGECLSGFCQPDAKVCLCLASSTIELTDGTCGRIGSNHGDYCTEKTQCDRLKFLECNITEPGTYGMCTCGIDMTYEDNARCRVFVGKNCEKNQNCVPNAVCNHLNAGGRCECEPDYLESIDYFCHPSYGKSCNNFCKDGLGLECNLGTCKCPIGQAWRESFGNANSYHCVALVAGNCSVDASYCTENSHCTKAGTCECDEGYSWSDFESRRRCLRDYDQPCDEEDICNPRHDFLVCSAPINGTCKCKYDQQQIYNPELGVCQSVAGGHCGILVENNGLNMTCASNSDCQPDEYGINKCVCTIFPGEDGTVCLSEVPTTTRIPSGSSGMFSVTTTFLVLFFAILSKSLLP